MCTIFNAIELSSIYFSPFNVFHDISKQIQQRARIAGTGKIFARWHLGRIAVTGYYYFFGFFAFLVRKGKQKTNKKTDYRDKERGHDRRLVN